GPVGSNNFASDAAGQTAGLTGCEPGSESLSTFIFRDYFAMITKGAVSGAIDLLKSYPYQPTGVGASGATAPTGPTGATAEPESLSSIAENFSGVQLEYLTRPGDTLGTVAARFGLSPSALQLSNLHVNLLGHSERLP